MTYRISMSNKKDIFTNEEGVKKLIENISSNFVIIGNEVINPSFIISITEEWQENLSPVRQEEKEIISGHIDEKKRAFVIDEIKKIANEKRILPM